MAIFKHGSIVIDKNSEQLSTVKNLTFDDPQMQVIEPIGASQKVRLPRLLNDDCDGLIFWIGNASELYLINVYTDINDGENLISVINPKNAVIFISDGDTWVGSSMVEQNQIDILATQIFN